jgi:hypothetical protein
VDSDLHLRQQEKWLRSAYITLRVFGKNKSMVPLLTLTLSYFKMFRSELYNLMKTKTISTVELQRRFYDEVKHKITDDNNQVLSWVEVYLLSAYSKYKYVTELDSDFFDPIYPLARRVILKSLINTTSSETFVNIYNEISRNVGRFGLDHFLSKIELTENLKI